MSDPERRALELRWLQNHRDLCRLREMRPDACEFFADWAERLNAEQEQIETQLAVDCSQVLYYDNKRPRPRTFVTNDDLLSVTRYRDVICVESAYGGISTCRDLGKPSRRLRRSWDIATVCFPALHSARRTSQAATSPWPPHPGSTELAEVRPLSGSTELAEVHKGRGEKDGSGARGGGYGEREKTASATATAFDPEAVVEGSRGTSAPQSPLPASLLRFQITKN
jgi:hypothetical protein